MKSKTSEQYDVIVVGGGAAGLMAAGRAAERGKKVVLLEKNRSTGEKLKITGGGRCNIFNAEEDSRELLKNYGDSSKYLHSPFAEFGMPEARGFFESHDLPIVVEARKRAFPKSQRAYDVHASLERYCSKHGVEIRTGEKVVRVLGDKGVVKEVVTMNGSFTADSVILATGGLSHPETGSTGEGFKWLSKIGHTVTEPTPNIVPLTVSENWIKKLSGTSLSYMKIHFHEDGEKKFTKKGKILFTHFGLSGPLILNSAAEVNDLLHAGSVTATIDTYPDTDHGSVEKQILKVFDTNKNKELKSVIKEIMPTGMATAFEDLFPAIDTQTKVHSISKEERKLIAHTLKALPVTITGLEGFDRAVVSDGGVTLNEIDMKAMRSKLYSNLYIIGDLLHIRRPSGGYSLQLCWTTGYIAGSQA